MMAYCVVEFSQENKSQEVIQKDWLVSHKYAFFPPTKDYFKYITKKIEDIRVKRWNICEVKILREFGKFKFNDQILL